MSTRNRSADARNRAKLNAESELLKDLKSSGVRTVGSYFLGKTIGEGEP